MKVMAEAMKHANPGLGACPKLAAARARRHLQRAQVGGRGEDGHEAVERAALLHALQAPGVQAQRDECVGDRAHRLARGQHARLRGTTIQSLI